MDGPIAVDDVKYVRVHDLIDSNWILSDPKIDYDEFSCNISGGVALWDIAKNELAYSSSGFSSSGNIYASTVNRKLKEFDEEYGVVCIGGKPGTISFTLKQTWASVTSSCSISINPSYEANENPQILIPDGLTIHTGNGTELKDRCVALTDIEISHVKYDWKSSMVYHIYSPEACVYDSLYRPLSNLTNPETGYTSSSTTGYDFNTKKRKTIYVALDTAMSTYVEFWVGDDREHGVRIPVVRDYPIVE